MAEAISDTDAYLEQNHEIIEEYLAYKASEEFKASLPGRLQEALLAFQKQSGYQEVFLANIKVVSPEYARYTERLEEANQSFFAWFPEARELYP